MQTLEKPNPDKDIGKYLDLLTYSAPVAEDPVHGMYSRQITGPLGRDGTTLGVLTLEKTQEYAMDETNILGAIKLAIISARRFECDGTVYTTQMAGLTMLLAHDQKISVLTDASDHLDEMMVQDIYEEWNKWGVELEHNDFTGADERHFAGRKLLSQKSRILHNLVDIAIMLKPTIEHEVDVLNLPQRDFPQ